MALNMRDNLLIILSKDMANILKSMGKSILVNGEMINKMEKG